MTRWPGYYDVVILPPASVRDYAITLSRQLRGYGGRWSLGKRAFLPHISLYHIPVADAEFENFVVNLQRVVDSARWGMLETTGFEMPLLMLDRPEWLKNLHRRVVLRTLAQFDWKYGAEQKWSLEWFSGRSLELARRYLRKYGTPMVGMNFRPHITLSSFADKRSPAVQLNLKRMRFGVDRLYICELGESHSCQKIVREIVPRLQSRSG